MLVCLAGLDTISLLVFYRKFTHDLVPIMASKMKKRRYTRLTEPMVRDKGALRPASWEEALDQASNGLRRLVERHGPRAFGMFSCSKSTNEMNFAAQKFARVVIGSNNIDSCNRT